MIPSLQRVFQKILARRYWWQWSAALKRNDAGPVTVDRKDTRIEKVENNTRSEERIHLG
jgi:hypothetical protein